jgi:GH24 family phage-related lysozyme (muramidase)
MKHFVMFFYCFQEDPNDADFVKEIIKRVNQNIPVDLPANAKSSLVSNCSTDGTDRSSNNITTQQFALALNDWASTHGHSTASTNDLLRLLRDSIPGLNLPLSKKDQQRFCDKKITNNTIKQYIQTDLKCFPTDVCRRECMAFRGQQFIVSKGITEDCSR